MIKTNVFISYNWGSEKIVEDLENRLEPYADVRRDKKSLLHWQSITEFMKTIRRSDLVAIIISDAYLKSVACLYEIMQLLKDENWIEHTMFVVECDATKIYKPINQLDYVKYWNEEYDKLDEALKNFDRATTTQQAEELKKIELIKLHISEFMQVVADRNNPKVDIAIEEIEKRVKRGYEQLNSKIDEGLLNGKDDSQDKSLLQQPIFDIKITAVNKQIPGTADVVNLWDSSTLLVHKNLRLSFELVNDVIVRNVILFGKHIDTLIEPQRKYYLIIAFEDSSDAKRWSKYITVIKHDEYRERDGYPEEFVVEYEDRFGDEKFQTFELCSKGGTKYYCLSKK